MVSEVVLVGGLVDWFVVIVLFKFIFVRYFIFYINIVVNNKWVIVDNLFFFVKDKFFYVMVIEKLIKESDFVKGVGRWLFNVNNSIWLSCFLCDVLSGILWVIDDKLVKVFIVKMVYKGLK